MAEEYEQLREQKMKELQEKMAEQQERQRKTSEAEMQLEEALKIVLSPEAKTRLANVKLVNRELYLTASQTILYLAKAKKLGGKITDEQLKELLRKLSEKKEVVIKRK